jgi:ribosomal protein L24E
MKEIEMECEECNKPFEEGKLIYVYSDGSIDNYFCSKECFHDWIDDEVYPQIYHRNDFKEWLD